MTKIIEILKEIPLIDKKISKNQGLLQQYSSATQIGDVESFQFGNAKEQTANVSSILQSIIDLGQRRAELRRMLALTNATVRVTIDKETKTITEWIEYRQKTIDMNIMALNALNNKTGLAALNSTKSGDPTIGVRVVQFYSEAEKINAIEYWMDRKNKIDTTLEIVNATTDVVA